MKQSFILYASIILGVLIVSLFPISSLFIVGAVVLFSLSKRFHL